MIEDLPALVGATPETAPPGDAVRLEQRGGNQKNFGRNLRGLKVFDLEHFMLGVTRPLFQDLENIIPGIDAARRSDFPELRIVIRSWSARAVPCSGRWKTGSLSRNSSSARVS